MFTFSNPMLVAPETPQTTNRHAQYYSTRPRHSSPLAEQLSSPTSLILESPSAQAHARRRAQYKSTASSSSSHASSSRSSSSGRISSPIFTPEENPQKTLMRQRLKARCVESARRAKERSLKSKRWASSDASSDGIDVDMDVDDVQEETDEQVLNDELFRRIVQKDKRKRLYNYRLSYEYDVGSSFDPDMEDISTWEAELRQDAPSSTPTAVPSSTPTVTDVEPPDDIEAVDDDELAALYDQYIEAQSKDLPDELDGVTEDLLNEMFSGIDDI